jgi:hypothetical protein
MGGGVTVPLPVAPPIPGGTHPPLMQTPPPRTANGSGVAHVEGCAGGGVDGGGVDGGGVGGGVLPTLESPGGNHPPFTHVPPPIEANGSGVAHEEG